MAFHITQCPCCNSTFSINAQLLHAANGKVRCGACLSVFLAEQQLVDSEPATDGSETNDSVFVGHAPEDYFDPASFLIREALQQQPMYSRVATAESEVTGKAEAERRSNSAPALLQPSVSRESAEECGPAPGSSRDKARLPDKADDMERSLEAHRSNQDPNTDTVSEKARDRHSTDRAAPLVSHSAVRPDPHLAAQADRAENTGEAETAGLSAENNPVSQTRQAAAVPEESKLSEAEHDVLATHDRSPKEADHGLIRNREDPEPDNGQARGSLTQEKLTRGAAVATPFPDPVTEQHADAANSSEAIRTRTLKIKLKDEQAPEQFAAENLASLQAVATPVQLHSDSPTRWGRILTLLLSAVLLGMSLAGQHLWRNQEFFSQQARWRPLLEWVCADRGCDLPLYEDLPAIEPSNLSVRSHPNRADAIMVQVQIRNTAPFEQAFPVMIVGFNTADNELIALREFSPAEYLQGELPESATMPVMAPVPINLPLIDPGEDAVNYTLAFRRP